MFHNIYIFGLGMMGGSLAHAIKRGKNCKKVYAYDTCRQSLLFAKKNLLIDDYDVSREIEAVYTTRKERVVVNLSLLKENSDKIRAWAEEKRNSSKNTITREFAYNKIQDLKLLNLLEDRDYHIGLRVMSLKNYIKSLKNLKELIESKYK